MAQPECTSPEPPLSQSQSHPLTPPPAKRGFFHKIFSRAPRAYSSDPVGRADESQHNGSETDAGMAHRRANWRVTTGLPRAQTFKRQLSESRARLTPVETTPDERRAMSADRRSRVRNGRIEPTPFPDLSAHPRPIAGPRQGLDEKTAQGFPEPDDALEQSSYEDDDEDRDEADYDPSSDTQSVISSRFEHMIQSELEDTWILNLSMKFRDHSRREKFFVTYRDRDNIWRRVTVSVDYREPPEDSLEHKLGQMKSQRDKNSEIYEAIRDSLHDIRFYETVTNLKLQTSGGRLHVHVVEDGNAIIPWPPIRQVQHIDVQHVRESDMKFIAHLSGFVYRVSVDGQVVIKKEIPSPETIEEFLYEVNALSRVNYSDNVIRLRGIVVDDDEEHVKGLLIDYAENGSLADWILDHCKGPHAPLDWGFKEKWARQIVQGLADLHDSGFVQGDFTLSNIVVDEHWDAKIIDINRRGCPIGWEPPEAKALIAARQGLSLYIGVKSDLYQLGMVLWALAMEDDQPDLADSLSFPEDVLCPSWYRKITETCLSEDPRHRVSASQLVSMFPPQGPTSISVEDGDSRREYRIETNGIDGTHTCEADTPRAAAHDSLYTTRGRSPPESSDGGESRGRPERRSWEIGRDISPSYTDDAGEARGPLLNGLSQHPVRIDTTDHDAVDASAEETPRAEKMKPLAEGEDTPTMAALQTATPELPAEDEAAPVDESPEIPEVSISGADEVAAPPVPEVVSAGEPDAANDQEESKQTPDEAAEEAETIDRAPEATVGEEEKVEATIAEETPQAVEVAEASPDGITQEVSGAGAEADPGVTGPEEDPEVGPEVVPEVTPETAPETAPETTLRTTPEAALELAPEALEAAPEAAPQATESKAEVLEAAPEVAPQGTESTAKSPEVAPEAVPETVPEVVPEAVPAAAVPENAAKSTVET